MLMSLCCDADAITAAFLPAFLHFYQLIVACLCPCIFVGIIVIVVFI